MALFLRVIAEFCSFQLASQLARRDIYFLRGLLDKPSCIVKIEIEDPSKKPFDFSTFERILRGSSFFNLLSLKIIFYRISIYRILFGNMGYPIDF